MCEDMGRDQSKETILLTRNYEYEESFQSFCIVASGELMRKMDPVLSKIQFVSSERSGPIKSSLEEGSFETQPFEWGQTIKVSYDSVLKSDIDYIIESIYESAKSGLESLMPQIFRTLGEVCDAAGQTVDAKGQLYDGILQALEKVEMAFDENGNPTTTLILPKSIETIIIKNPPPEDFIKKQEEIIERKRTEFFAKKRTRKLY